jgi:ankyrin repeat protein
MTGLRLLSTWLMVPALCVTTLVAAGADARLADAAENMDEVALRSLLQQGIDVNAAQVDGMTALHWAAYRDDLDTVKLLMRAGADVASANRYGVTPLSLACTNANVDMVKFFLDAGADPNTTLRGGETALMTAARSGKLGSIKALLSRGADINATVGRGQTALIWAAAEGHADVVEELIQAGADFRKRLDTGFSPLLFAVREGRIDVVRVLLKAGADANETIVERKDFEVRLGRTGRPPRVGTTPLIMAVENGHFELAARLLDAGADPNGQSSGVTALHTLANVRKPGRGDGGDPAPQGSGNMSSLDLVRDLAAHGADVNTRLEKGRSNRARINRKGATPFMLAAITADVPFMRTLVEVGADPQLPNAENCTPLMGAAGVGTTSPGEVAGTEPEVLESVEYLLELGADINAVDDNGETAMHGAAYKHLPKVAQFLADKGADIEIWNRKNKHGWTPWLLAEGHRYGNFKPSPEVMETLRGVMLAAGVDPPSEPTPRMKREGYR